MVNLQKVNEQKNSNSLDETVRMVRNLKKPHIGGKRYKAATVSWKRLVRDPHRDG